MDKYIENKIVELYPDMMVTDGFQRHPGFEILVRKASQDLNLPMKEYLASIGINYINKPRDDSTLNAAFLKTKLLEAYPNKEVTHLANFGYYYELRNYAADLGLRPVSVLKDLGFTWKYNNEFSFDHEAVEKLIKDFEVKSTELANWLGINKMNISQRRKSRRPIRGLWTNYTMEKLEIELVNHMIESHTTTFQDEEIIIAIRNNGNDCCIFIRNQLDVKCFFSFSIEMEKGLKQNRFHRFDEDDFYVYDNLKIESFFGKKMGKPANANAGKAFTRRKAKLRMSPDEYLQFLGFDGYLDERMLNDTQIKEILQKYIIHSNYVYLPIDAEEYFRLTNKASRSGYTLEELIEFFGFKKADTATNEEVILKLTNDKWTIDADKVAFFLYKHAGDASHFYLELVSRLLGVSLDSLKERIRKYAFIEESSRLNLEVQCCTIYENYKNMQKENFCKEVMNILT